MQILPEFGISTRADKKLKPKFTIPIKQIDLKREKEIPTTSSNHLTKIYIKGFHRLIVIGGNVIARVDNSNSKS